MAHEMIEPIWVARLPHQWPAPPASMSFSDLHTIEQCPRRWSLTFGSYPDIWSRRGYPAKIYLGTVRGLVLHSALDSIVNALNRVGCSSVTSEKFVEVMRQLGGYSDVIGKAADDTLIKLNANPRFARTSRDVIDNFLRAAPTLREQLQILTSKLRLAAVPTGSKPELKERAPLQNGTYTEIELIVSKHKWHGFADILTLSESRCEIVDFKSGDPSPAHEDQIRIYSLLWALDQELNPTARLANRLTLSYPTGDVSVKPLSETELIALENMLIARTQRALTAIQISPPHAAPSVENCTFCAVRQLCDDYWCESTQKQLAQGPEGIRSDLNEFTDIEVEIGEPESPTLWRATVAISRLLSPRRPVLVRIPQESHSVVALIKTGRRVRIIDAVIKDATNEEPSLPLINLMVSSEVYVV